MTRGVRPILILAAAVRVALLLAAWGEPGRLLTPDSHEYAALARSLGNGEGFTADGQPEIFRTPGYPMLLLIGTVFQAARLQAVAVVQVLADVLLVYLTYLLAMLTVADRRAALAAAGWQAVCVVAVVSSVRILSDGTYACLLTLALCLVAAHLRTGRWWALLSGAGVTAAACYVRPVGLSMAVVMAAVLLTRRRRWRRTAAFAGVVAALLSPWVVRNWTEARYAGFSSFATDSMYYFAVPALRAERALQDPAAARDLQRRRGARHAATQPTPGDAAEWRARQARRAIAEHPLEYAWLHLRGCAGVYLPGAPYALEMLGLTSGQKGTRDVLRREGLVAAARHYFGHNTAALLLAAPMVLLLGLKYASIAVGAVLRLVAGRGGLGRFRLGAEVWLLVLVVIVGTLLPGPYGLPRYRVPLAPILSIAAGAGVIALWDRLRRRGR